MCLRGGRCLTLCAAPNRTEFVKTRSQFAPKGVKKVLPHVPPCDKRGLGLTRERTLKEGPIAIIKNTLRDKGITGLYSGCGALVIGNAAKAGVRFVSYDQFKAALADKDVSRVYGWSKL